MKINKNIREQRNVRTARLKSRVEASNQQIQHLNHHYFQIPLPEHYNNRPCIINPKTLINTSNVSYQSLEPPELDERKQQIKQKIKFRVKQQLWNLLKKNSQKEEGQLQPQSSQNVKKENKKVHSTGYIMGRSYTRVSRDSIGTRRNWCYSQSKKKEQSSSKDFQFRKTSGANELKPRRAWSSSVKMREKDKSLIERHEIRINKNYLQMEKMDSYNIQPWKAIEDPEHHFIQ